MSQPTNNQSTSPNKNLDKFEQILREQSDLYAQELISVLKKMSGLDNIQIVSNEISKDFHIETDMIACVPFSGMVTGEFILAMPTSTATNIFSEAENAEERQELMAECLNLVSGSRISELSRLFEKLTIITPRFISGHLHYRNIKNHSSVLKTSLGDIFCYFYIDRMRLDIAEAYKLRSSELQKINDELVAASIKLRDQQAQLVQSEKMASLGMMAAGVAHEINNPLSFVSSNNSILNSYVEAMRELLEGYDQLILLLNSGKADEARAEIVKLCEFRKKEDITFVLQDTKKLLGQSKEGLERIRGIVNGLKRFARLDDGGIKLVKINEEVQNVLMLLQNELKHACSVQLHLESERDVECLPGEISQVLMNIIVNAAQAIDKKPGQIVVTTKDLPDAVSVSIEDNGVGISSENFPKLFSPFFTTKPVGEGTGLGLAISYGIIQKHSGKILVESALGKGSKFQVLLPFKSAINSNDTPTINREFGQGTEPKPQMPEDLLKRKSGG